MRSCSVASLASAARRASDDSLDRASPDCRAHAVSSLTLRSNSSAFLRSSSLRRHSSSVCAASRGLLRPVLFLRPQLFFALPLTGLLP